MSDQEETQHIVDESDLRKYRIELPNLYDDIGLDPFEFRLLAHYKRIGNCWETVRTTAKHCLMSVGQVSAKRQSLAQKGLITIEDRKDTSSLIGVVDKWAENFGRYCSPGEQHCSRGEQPCSCGEPKNKPSKNKPSKKDNGADKPRPRDELFDAISEACAVDPATAGASVGKVKAVLLKADPPYTANEVRAWRETWPAWKDKPPTLWQLKEQIGSIRLNGNGNGTKPARDTTSGATQDTSRVSAAVAAISARAIAGAERELSALRDTPASA